MLIFNHIYKINPVTSLKLIRLRKVDLIRFSKLYYVDCRKYHRNRLLRVFKLLLITFHFPVEKIGSKLVLNSKRGLMSGLLMVLGMTATQVTEFFAEIMEKIYSKGWEEEGLKA